MSADLPLSAVLERIDAWYAEHSPIIHASFNSGVSDAELDALEAKIGLPLPLEFREVYKWHDGQDWTYKSGKTCGYMLFYALLTLREIAELWDRMRNTDEVEQYFHDEINQPRQSYPSEAIQQTHLSSGWLGFLGRDEQELVGIDLSPAPKGVRGQVINFGWTEPDMFVLAHSITEFFEIILGRLESGQCRIEICPNIFERITLYDIKGRFSDNVKTIAELMPDFLGTQGILDFYFEGDEVENAQHLAHPWDRRFDRWL